MPTHQAVNTTKPAKLTKSHRALKKIPTRLEKQHQREKHNSIVKKLLQNPQKRLKKLEADRKRRQEKKREQDLKDLEIDQVRKTNC